MKESQATTTMSSLTILIWSLSLTGFSNSNRAILWAIVVWSYPGCKTILFTETGVSVPSSLLRLNSPKDSLNNYMLLNILTIKGQRGKKTKQVSMHFLRNETYIHNNGWGYGYGKNNMVRASSQILMIVKAGVWLLLFG